MLRIALQWCKMDWLEMEIVVGFAAKKLPFIKNANGIMNALMLNDVVLRTTLWVDVLMYSIQACARQCPGRQGPIMLWHSPYGGKAEAMHPAVPVPQPLLVGV
jgi:hypothetical protein|uniref:Uncharacterized protein n=1 Tax=Eutreptiella gymnastica TaxID=73025 RepID=A0A6T2AEC3_9EUGL